MQRGRKPTGNAPLTRRPINITTNIEFSTAMDNYVDNNGTTYDVMARRAIALYIKFTGSVITANNRNETYIDGVLQLKQ